jgi:hypothetical protein
VEFFTAIRYLNQQMVIDATEKKYYNHLEAFRDIAEPSILATDIYPVIPEMNWNGRGNSEDTPFIQDLYEFKVDRAYRMAKAHSMEAEGRKFYPIVQTFGRWANIGGRDQWTGWGASASCDSESTELLTIVLWSQMESIITDSKASKQELDTAITL